MLIYFLDHEIKHWVWPTPQQCPACGCWPRLTPCWSQAGAGSRFGKAPAVAGTVALLGSFLWAEGPEGPWFAHLPPPDSNQITVWKLWFGDISTDEIIFSHKHPWTACFTINGIQVRLAVTQKLTCFHHKWIGFARYLMQVKAQNCKFLAQLRMLWTCWCFNKLPHCVWNPRGFMPSLYHLSLVDPMADLSSDL